jgi:hypothetical protein
MIFAQLAGKSWLEFATLTQGEVHMNLMPPGTPKVYFFFLFCITWADSVRRRQSLPKPDIMLLTVKNVTQDVIFPR